MITFLRQSEKKNNIWNNGMQSVLLFKLLNVGIIILISVQGITNIITKRLKDTKGVIKGRQNVLNLSTYLCVCAIYEFSILYFAQMFVCLCFSRNPFPTFIINVTCTCVSNGTWVRWVTVCRQNFVSFNFLWVLLAISSSSFNNEK